MVKYSIIICTYNNFEVIKTVITNLLSSIKPYSDKTEVIVVDSSDDGSVPKLKDLYLSAGISFINPKDRVLPGPARNLGFKKAIGDILIFIDGDCVPSEGWFKGMLEAQPQLAENIVCGAVDIYEPAHLSQFMEYIFGKLPENSRIKRGPYNFVITENMMIARSAFVATGGFNNSDSANDAQMDVARRKAKLGIYFEPKAKVLHIHPKGFMFHLKKYYRIGKEQYLLIDELPDYRVGKIIKMCLPIAFILKWLKITRRILFVRPDYLLRYLLVQPFFILGLLLYQAGLWVGLFIVLYKRAKPLRSLSFTANNYIKQQK